MLKLITGLRLVAGVAAFAFSVPFAFVFAQNIPERSQPYGRPSVEEYLRNGGGANWTANDGYRYGTRSLFCSLAETIDVKIVIVNDPEDFTFFAAKARGHRVIYANERTISANDVTFTIFTFYHECALHALHDVDVRHPNDPSNYSSALLRTAECLSVLPTARLLEAGGSLPVFLISDKLKNIYGSSSSSTVRLQQCSSPAYAMSEIQRYRRGLPRR